VALAGAAIAVRVAAVTFVVAFTTAMAAAVTLALAIAFVFIAFHTFIYSISISSKGGWMQGLIGIALAGLFVCADFLLFKQIINTIKNAPVNCFNHAKLTQASFVNAQLHNCDFTNAVLDQVDWSGVAFARSGLKPARLFQSINPAFKQHPKR
jgi:hypothetical protein